MKRIATIALSLIFAISFAPSAQGQTDTIKSEMRFDLGITRDMNINLWPIFKRYKTKESNEVQAIFPLFKYKRYYLAPAKHSHLFPIYLSDSSSAGKDFRFLSLYYPSIVRTSKDYIKKSSSFKFIELAPEINFVEVTKSSDGLFVQNNMLFMLWFKNDLALHRSHFIFFPAYWSFKNPQYSTHTIFPFTSWGAYNQNKETYSAITPLYWHFTKNDGYRNVLFPLWLNQKHGTGENATYTNLFLPIYWSLRDKERDNKVLIPVVWKFKNRNQSSFTFAPILSWGKSYSKPNDYLVVTPIFWHFTRGDATNNILFPMWWNRKQGSGNNAVSSTLVLPAYWSHKSRFKNNTVFFPIVWSLKSSTYHTFTVAPLLSTGHSTDSSRNHLMVTPLIWHFKKDETTRNVLFPLWWYKRIGQGDYAYHSNIIAPFYLSFGDKRQKTQIVFPIIWNLKNEDYSSLTFAPLFSSGRSTDNAIGHLMITPLFWNFRNGDSNSSLLFPIWWYTHKGSGNNQVYSNILFPLYFRFKDRMNDNTVLFPVYWSLKNQRYRSYTLFPLYSKGSSVNGTKTHQMITPLYWQFNSGEKRRTILFPLWLNRESGSGDNRNNLKVVFPFYWAYNDKVKDNKVLFPIIWSLKDTHYDKLIVAPFFSNGHSPDNKYGYLMVTPLYWHFKIDEGYRNILFPLWWNKKRGTGDNIVYSNLIIPVYWAKKDRKKDNSVIFPIIWKLKNQHYTSFTAAPFYSKGISSDSSKTHLTITPLFWQFRNGVDYRIVLFPVWWNMKTGIGNDAVYSKVVFPLYWSHNDRWKSNRVIFPFYWNLNSIPYSSRTVAPIFSAGHSPDNSRSHFMLTPLFWHIKDGYKSSNVLFPIWWNSQKGTIENPRITSLLLPLYWSVKDKEIENTVIFPILWNFRNSNYSSSTLFPLISFGHTPDGTWRHFVVMPLYWNILKGDDQDRFLIPIWWSRKRGSGGDATRSTIILPVFWSYKDNYKDNVFLFPLIWSLKNVNYKSFTLAPLFSFGHSTEKRREHAVVTPLFWHFKNAYSEHNILIPIYWNSKRGIGERSRYTNALFPIFLSFRDAKRSNRILFPIVWNLKNSKYSSSTIFPLFAYGHSPDSSKRHLAITPLYWKIHRPDYNQEILFPFYSRYTDITGKSKYNSLVFVVRSQKEKERKTIALIWPICEYTKDVSYRYFRFAPIIWYKKSPASSYFSVQPFYLQSRDSISKNYYILWQLYAHKIYFNEKVSRSILWKAITWDHYYNKDYEFRILYLLYANVKKQGNIERTLFPLYQYTHQQNGNKSVALLLHFYSSLRRKIPETKEYYQEQRIFWFIRIRSNYKVLKEKGVKENLIKQGGS